MCDLNFLKVVLISVHIKIGIRHQIVGEQQHCSQENGVIQKMRNSSRKNLLPIQCYGAGAGGAEIILGPGAGNFF